MKRFLYRLMYRLGRPAWDTGVTPPEVIAFFEQDGSVPGHALDLGCGTGTNALYMARRGWQVTGLDFSPEAIAAARRKATVEGITDRVRFQIADVTRLADLDLTHVDFALDMGCFHGLGQDGQRRYVEGLAALMAPGGRWMLYALKPRQSLGWTYGMTPDQVRAAVASHFEIIRLQTDESPTGGTWFWLRRAPATA